jgi:imidazolonepropionase-like amidohydrolase
MTTVIRCGTLFDGTGPAAEAGGQLVIEDGRLVDGPAPEGAEVVDLGSAFVMPGIIDAHTHLSVMPGRGDQLGQLRQPAGQQALRVPDNLRADLRAGTTTMRIMAEEDWLDVHARDVVAAGELEGPELLIATRGLTATNGHGRAKSAFDGVDELRRGARENLAHGADFLKLFATGGVSSGSTLDHSVYSVGEMRAVVEEAQRAGTYVAAHAHGGLGLRAAVEAGIRTIEHAALAGEREVELMLEAECWVVGTYTILFHPDGIERGDAGNPSVLQALRIAREHVAERAPAVLGSGLRFALGTDSMHGHMAFEIQTAIRFGVAPGQALLAATAHAAQMLGIADRVGSLEPGKDADLIALDGDPLDDPSALERVVYVMKKGRPAWRSQSMEFASTTS